MAPDESDDLFDIVNIVVAGELGTGEINVEVLGEDMTAADINTMPGRAYVKRTESSPTLMLYRSGKYVIAGAKDEVDVATVIDWSTAEMKRLDVDFDSEVVQNTRELRYMVVKAEFGRMIDLHHLMLELGMESTEYEPEQFPALIYRDAEYGCTSLIFSTGCVMITGVRNLSEARGAFEHLRVGTDKVLGVR